MKRGFIFVLLAALILVAALNRQTLFRTDQKTLNHLKTAYGAPDVPAAEVGVTRVETFHWQPYLETMGSVTAVNGVTVSTDLGGRIVAVNFDSGSEVRKGALLVQIDIEREKAQLAQAEAKRDLSRLNLERSRNLLDRHTISQSEFDSIEADVRQAEGAVQEQQSIIDKKTIRARFDGIAGIRQVNVGQYLNPGQPIVTLQSVDPVYVDFELPQEQLSKVIIGNAVEITVDAYPETFRGVITAINAEVEQDSRYIRVRATFPNPDRKLHPGMFAKVDVQSGNARDVLAVPISAVRAAPYGDSVFVVAQARGGEGKPRKVLEQHFVKLGQRRGDLVAVVSGLQAGDEIVTTDVFRMRNGTPVLVRNGDGQPGAAQGDSPSPNS